MPTECSTVCATNYTALCSAYISAFELAVQPTEYPSYGAAYEPALERSFLPADVTAFFSTEHAAVGATK